MIIATSLQSWGSVGMEVHGCELYFIPKQKALSWVILAASSLPLHVFWNSTVSRIRMTHNCFAITIIEDFLHGGQWEILSVASDLDHIWLTLRQFHNTAYSPSNIYSRRWLALARISHRMDSST